MFLQFSEDKERIKYGDSVFLELQYCKAKRDTEIKQLCAVHNIRHWANDSLYIYEGDTELFYSTYASLLGNAFYNNGRSGKIDLCGINYFTPQDATSAAERIKTEKPIEYDIFLTWLQKGEKYNGFYLLGL